jgi:hypothetical protein
LRHRELQGRILLTVELLRMRRDGAVKKGELGHFAPMLTDAKKPVTPLIKNTSEERDDYGLAR